MSNNNIVSVNFSSTGAATWQYKGDFIPANGEIIILDGGAMKRGDGVTPPISLPQYSPTGAEADRLENFLGNVPASPSTGVYGVYIDVLDRSFLRLGESVGWYAGDDFTNNSFYGQIRRCNLADDGTVNAYYGDANYTEDGSNGQVMVEIPAFSYKVSPSSVSTDNKSMYAGAYYITPGNTTANGFKLHPAFLDNDGTTILNHIYIGAYEASLYDASAAAYNLTDAQNMDTATDMLSSIAGAKPCSGLTQNLTRTALETMAKKRGNGWHSNGILEVSAYQMLMLIEMGSFNMQYNIGQGVTSITDNGSYNCSSLTGSTSSLGNGTGNAASTINEIGGTQTTYTTSGKVAVSWRGIENPWGNIWEHVHGITFYGDGTMNGGKPVVCTDRNYTDFTSIGNKPSNYTILDFTLPNANNYINAFGYDADFDWLFIPSESGNGANSSVPIGDYVWLMANMNKLCTAWLGAGWHSVAGPGLFSWICSGGVGYRSRIVGGRLVFSSVAMM